VKEFAIGIYTLFQPYNPFRKRCFIVSLWDSVRTLKCSTSNGLVAFKSWFSRLPKHLSYVHLPFLCFNQWIDLWKENVLGLFYFHVCFKLDNGREEVHQWINEVNTYWPNFHLNKMGFDFIKPQHIFLPKVNPLVEAQKRQMHIREVFGKSRESTHLNQLNNGIQKCIMKDPQSSRHWHLHTFSALQSI
jgi:hypothetical protein